MNSQPSMLTRFFRNASLLALVELVLKFKALILLPLLTRHFGSVNYGAWSQVSVLITTLSPLLVLGTDSAILRYLPGRDIYHQSNSFSQWLIFLVAGSILVSILGMSFDSQIATVFWGNEALQFEDLIVLAFWSIIVTVFINFFKTWFRVFDNAKGYSKFIVGQSFINLIAVLLALWQKGGVYEVVAFSLFADVLFLVFCFYKIRSHLIIPTFNFEEFRRMLIFGVAILPSGYAMWALNSSDRLFLVQYRGLSEVGVYAVVYSLGYLVTQLIANPIWTMFPGNAAKYYQCNNHKGLHSLYTNSIRVIIGLSVPAIIALYFVGGPLLQCLATREFTSSSVVMVLVAIGYLFCILSSYQEVLLGLVERPYLGTISIIIAALMNLLFNFLLIPKWGLIGAASATAIGFGTQLICSTFWMKKYFPLDSGNAVKFATFVTPISLGIAVLVEFSLRVLGLSHVLYIASFAVVYAILLLFAYFLYDKSLFYSNKLF